MPLYSPPLDIRGEVALHSYLFRKHRTYLVLCSWSKLSIFHLSRCLGKSRIARHIATHHYTKLHHRQYLCLGWASIMRACCTLVAQPNPCRLPHRIPSAQSTSTTPHLYPAYTAAVSLIYNHTSSFLVCRTIFANMGNFTAPQHIIDLDGRNHPNHRSGVVSCQLLPHGIDWLTLRHQLWHQSRHIYVQRLKIHTSIYASILGSFREDTRVQIQANCATFCDAATSISRNKHFHHARESLEGLSQGQAFIDEN